MSDAFVGKFETDMINENALEVLKGANKYTYIRIINYTGTKILSRKLNSDETMALIMMLIDSLDTTV